MDLQAGDAKRCATLLSPASTPVFARANAAVNVAWLQAKIQEIATWMSQEVCKRLVNLGYNPNIPHL